MTHEETFEALIRVHPLYHDLVDTDVDEESGEEPEVVIFEVVETYGDYSEFDDEQVHIHTSTLKEMYEEPVEEQVQYKAELTSQFNPERGFYELTLNRLTKFQK